MGPITASILYSLVQCPHRVWLDASEELAKRDPVSPFDELLWERGTAVATVLDAHRRATELAELVERVGSLETRFDKARR